MLKRFITSLFCLFLIFVSIPIFGSSEFFSTPVYAGVDDDQYFVPLRSENDLVKAFQAYCKSRDLTIEGSLADAVTTFTTSSFNFCANSIGIDISELQAEIKADYDNAGFPVKFAFTQLGINAMNRIFAQFLQDNELQEGDTDVNKQVYSGEYYTDDDGNSCLVYYCSQFINTNNTNATFYDRYISMYGTAMKYDVPQLISLINGGTTSYVENIANNHITVSIAGSTNNYVFTNNNISQNYIYCNEVPSGNYRYTNGYGIPTVIKVNGVYHFGLVSKYQWYGVPPAATHTRYQLIITDLGTLTYSTGHYQSASINIISQQINNNNYEGDTYITNEGDIYNPPSETPPGGTDPGWNVGGGQGSYNDGQGNSYTINFPDFELPDLNIDWSIKGLGNKFPFSIPFDIASLVAVLNAEPEAPRFQGTMDLGITTYAYDINLAQFDTVASACRIAELLLLVFGLIMITRSIIKG